MARFRSWVVASRPAGRSAGRTFTVNSDSSGQQYDPAAAIDEENRFVLAWQDDMDGDGKPSILVRNFSFWSVLLLHSLLCLVCSWSGALLR